MKRKHDRTLEALFARPTSGTLRFEDIKALMLALDAEVLERAGSRVAFVLNDRIFVMHRPHPSPEMDKGAVEDIRKFLAMCGVKPGGH